MQIVFDNIIFSLQKSGGISVYWYEIASRILKENVDAYFIDRGNKNIISQKLNEHKLNKLNLGLFNIFFIRFIEPKLLGFNSKFIFHSSYNRVTSNKNALSVITIHDFVHEKYYKGIRKFLHSKLKAKAINQADAIIVISENTKKDLLQNFPYILKEKVHLVYNGASDDFFPILNKKQSNSFLYVGSREKYKNFELAVKWISKFEKYSLNIVGSNLNIKELKFLNKFLPNRWQLYCHISNFELNKLYNNSFALIYPSLYEGFGIPILEAMKAGCPFIALNVSSLPEVAGDAGVLLDDLDQKSFEMSVNYIIQNRETIIQKGYLQARKFSWDKCFQETFNIYKSLYYS